MTKGTRVEIAPHLDLWMRGARYGTVVSVKDGIARVRMDHPQVKVLAKIKVEDLKVIE
jgi:hypothetical protein